MNVSLNDSPLEDEMSKQDIAMLENHPGTSTSEENLPEYLSWSMYTTTIKFWKSVMFCVLVIFGAVFDGYALVVSGTLIAQAAFIKQFGTIVGPAGDLELDALHVAAWGAILMMVLSFSVGQLAGMMIGPLISDTIGRKYSMWCLALSLTIATVLEIVAREWQVYAASKLFTGIGTGMVQSGLTVYIAEVAPANIRGAMLSSYSLFYAAGQITGSVALNVISEQDQYRSVFYSEFVYLGLFLPALLFAPESPWWAIRKGRKDLAMRYMNRLYSDVPSFDIEKEYALLERAITNENALTAGAAWKQYVACFKGANWRRTYISFLPLAFQQFVGAALFFGYVTYFFALAGYAHPFTASLIQGLILLVFIIASFFVIDKIGRRPLLLWGGIVMSICSLATGGIGFMTNLPGAALVALTLIWTAAYAISAGPLGWSYVAETSTPQLRAKTAGMATIGTNLFGLIFNYCVPILLSPQQANWGPKIGLFFGGLTILGVVIMYFLVPETKGRSYAELDEMFEAEVPTRKFGSYICDHQSSPSVSAVAELAV